MIPAQLKQFMCYKDSKSLIGVADVDLPEIAYMSETIKGPGMAGEIDNPVVGNFQSMTTTINWRSLIDSNAVFIAPKSYLLDFRGSIEYFDEILGEYREKATKYIIKGIPKKLAPGKLDTATNMGTSTEFEVIYLKLVVDKREIIEIDKPNYKCVIDGIDYFEETRKNIGLI